MALKIKTGADALCELVENKKRISLKEASIFLNTSPDVVETWAEVLQENKLIKTEIGLNNMFLVHNDPSEKPEDREAKKSLLSYIDSKIPTIIKDSDSAYKKFQPYEERLKKLNRDISTRLRLIEKKESRIKNYCSSLDRLKKDCKSTEKRLEHMYNKSEDTLRELAKKHVATQLSLSEELIRNDRFAEIAKKEMIDFAKNNNYEDDELITKLKKIRSAKRQMQNISDQMKLNLDLMEKMHTSQTQADREMTEIQLRTFAEEMSKKKIRHFDDFNAIGRKADELRLLKESIDSINTNILDKRYGIKKMTDELVTDLNGKKIHDSTLELDRLNRDLESIQYEKDSFISNIDRFIAQSTDTL
ncbi:MAG: hypothetical protein KKF44_06640 [Nanoarchaeota archaeon]|nr:hypothetical protein [Nanoarchaeota archaeon]